MERKQLDRDNLDRLASKNEDPGNDSLRILNDTVILCTLVNPDGDGIFVSDCVHAHPSDPMKRSTNGIPRLYEKYIGHDDNRDFYMMNMSESVNANKVMYREWYPATGIA